MTDPTPTGHDTHDHDHHGHHHAHDDGHDPSTHAPLDEDVPCEEYEFLEIALRELLVEKGVIEPLEITRKIEEWEQKSPVDGTRVIARAWVDPGFKARLLADANTALHELDLAHPGPKLVALENTPGLHHMITCTLCSCYPRPLLGFPPSWYKSREYRARSVHEPRVVLREFGLDLPDNVTLRVVDSTADCRYLVIPVRPDGTEHLSETELADLVTRDSMIGVGTALAPATVEGVRA